MLKKQSNMEQRELLCPIMVTCLYNNASIFSKFQVQVAEVWMAHRQQFIFMDKFEFTGSIYFIRPIECKCVNVDSAFAHVYSAKNSLQKAKIKGHI